MDLEAVLNIICENLWYFTFVFVVGFGVYYTLRYKGLMLRSIPDMIRNTLNRDNDDRTLSPFETFCISMGSRIGVGNIAGVAVAIITGGPGAIFWMWVFAIIGSMTAFMENIMAQIYKTDTKNGGFFGGPAYCAQNALGNRKLGVLVSILTVIMFVVGFSGVNTACATSVVAGEFRFDYDWLIVPLIFSIFTFAILSKGMKMAAKASARLVPFMAIGWFVLAILLLCFNIDGVFNAFAMIFEYAFTVPAAIGGSIGSVIIIGLRRGIFSNEAGLGTVSNLSGTSYVKHPVNQGFVQAFGVMIDTLVICTLTALVILSYGSFDQIMALGLTDMQLVQFIAEDTPLGSFGSYLVSICAIFFAYTGMIAGFAICTSCLRFISDTDRAVKYLPLAYAIGGFSLGIGNVTAVFVASDIIMALVAIINIYIMIKVRKTIVAVMEDWLDQRKRGVKEPEFDPSKVPGCESIVGWTKGAESGE